jgi:general secretion pathway protein B
MSYILDALRRAQAERERGQVPGLEARTPVQTPPPTPQRRATAWWLGGALSVVLLAVAVVMALRGGPADPVAPVAPPLAQAPAPTAPGPLPSTPATMVVVSAPTPPPAGSGPLNATPSSPDAARPASQKLPAIAPAIAPVAGPATVSAPPAPAASALRAVQLAQLSADLRRELPALTLGGAIWSDNAASRFVIVNGLVLREGDTAAPGVVLERIGPKAVFLRWRDWRIEVPI